MSSTRVKDRKGVHLDFYETPIKTTQKLLEHFDVRGKLLEPAAGKGAILKAVGHPKENVTALDIQPSFRESLCDYADEVRIQDFLEYKDKKFDTIIANPPFSQSEAFIRHAFSLLDEGGKMAFLLRLPFLASVKRYSLFQELRPVQILVLSQRPKFGGDNIDSCDYAWFIWDEVGEDITMLDWLSPES